MRIEGWDPDPACEEILNVAEERLVEAAEAIAAAVRQRCPVGTVSHPMYKRGPYAGQFWTARDAGALKASVRVVQKTGATGQVLWATRNVRIYAGTRKAYYASIVEHFTPFFRPALYATQEAVKSILGVK